MAHVALTKPGVLAAGEAATGFGPDVRPSVVDGKPRFKRGGPYFTEGSALPRGGDWLAP